MSRYAKSLNSLNKIRILIVAVGCLISLGAYAAEGVDDVRSDAPAETSDVAPSAPTESEGAKGTGLNSGDMSSNPPSSIDAVLQDSAAPKSPEKGRVHRAPKKEAEGTQAQNRVNPIIKSKYQLNGQSLEVDTD